MHWAGYTLYTVFHFLPVTYVIQLYGHCSDIACIWSLNVMGFTALAQFTRPSPEGRANKMDFERWLCSTNMKDFVYSSLQIHWELILCLWSEKGFFSFARQIVIFVGATTHLNISTFNVIICLLYLKTSRVYYAYCPRKFILEFSY